MHAKFLRLHSLRQITTNIALIRGEFRDWEFLSTKELEGYML